MPRPSWPLKSITTLFPVAICVRCSGWHTERRELFVLHSTTTIHEKKKHACMTCLDHNHNFQYLCVCCSAGFVYLLLCCGYFFFFLYISYPFVPSLLCVVLRWVCIHSIEPYCVVFRLSCSTYCSIYFTSTASLFLLPSRFCAALFFSLQNIYIFIHTCTHFQPPCGMWLIILPSRCLRDPTVRSH